MWHLGETLPDWLADLEMEIYEQDGQVKVAMPASSMLLVFSSFFDKDYVANQMKTIEGQAEVLMKGVKGICQFGWVVDAESGTFSTSKDNHVRNQAYLDTVENDDEVVLFLEELNEDLLNDPSSLTLPEKDGGLPSSNSEGVGLRNKNHMESLQPAYFVDGKKVGAQRRVYAKLGVALNSTPVQKDLQALKGRWNGRGRVSDEIEGHTVAYGY